jgi:hypothetical protein
MQRQMAGDIGSVLLGRPSAAIGLGGQMLGQAQAGAAGPMGPQLFDPNVGINMALQQRGQDVTFQGMQAQAKAAGQAAGQYCWIMGAIGDNPKWLQLEWWILGSASYTLSSVKGLRPSGSGWIYLWHFKQEHKFDQS